MTGDYVDDRWVVAKTYFGGMFWFDVFTSVPVRDITARHILVRDILGGHVLVTDITEGHVSLR